MTTGFIDQKDVTLINIYSPNEASEFILQLLAALKIDIGEKIYMVGDFNIPLSPKDRTLRQKLPKDTITLNEDLDYMDLMDISRNLYPQRNEYTIFLQCTWNILQN